MRFLSLFLVLASPLAFSQWDFVSESSLVGIHRDFPKGASQYSNLKEVLFTTDTGVTYKTDHFRFEAKALVRSLQSPANVNREDFAFAELTPPRRLLKLYSEIGEDSENLTLVDTGSLWGTYNFENWQFTAGRRAIGIGVLRNFAVWNRLFPVVPTLSGYMFVFNPDIVDVRWSRDQWTVAAYSIFSQYYDDSITALEFIHYGEKLESHFLVSKWWNQPAAGYSGVVDTALGIFRLETLAVRDGDETKGGFQYGAGWERAFTSKLSFVAEYYHSSFGEKNPANYLLQDPTPFRLLLARDYFYPQVIYKLTDFLAVELGSIHNLVDGSSMLLVQSTYSFSDNVDIFGSIRKPLGKSGQEFGSLKVPLTLQAIEYVEWVSVGIRMTI